jgi:sigma-B regulation protein RsbU (phosphoserine phosphatase)
MVREVSRPPLEGEDRLRDLEHTLEMLREDSEVAHVLLGLSGVVAEVKSVEETLELTVRVVPDLLGADRCFAAGWDAAEGRFILHAHFGYDEKAAAQLRELAGRGDGLPLLRAALEARKPLLIPDVADDGRITTAAARQRGLGAYIGIPLLRRGEDFGGLGLEYSQPRRFTPKDEALVRGIARQVGAALANARQFNLLRSLRTFGLRVGSRLHLSAVVEEVAAGAASLLEGEGAALYLLDQARSALVGTASFGAAASVIDALDTIDLDAEPWSRLLEGEAVVVPRLERESGPHREVAVVAAPIPGADTPVLGAVLVFSERAAALGADELEALNVLAAQSSTAIENAYRFERQRRVARSLRRGLLSAEMPAMAGAQISAIYEPASGEADIGGDFYDVFDLSEGLFGIVVGDVSGKGAEAAARTAQAKYMLRAFATRNRSPASVLSSLNSALIDSLGEDRFATIAYGVFEPETRRFDLALAGHPSPLLYRNEPRAVEALELEGSIMGVFEGQRYEIASFQLNEGDVFLAYTDGLVDARRGGELYGRDRLQDALARLAPHTPPDELARRIYEEVDAFGEVGDDTVVFALCCCGKGP